MGRRLIIVVTSPLALDRMLGGQARFLADSGFVVSVACGAGPRAERFARSEDVRVDTLPLRREIAPCDDLRSLVAMYRLFREEQPDIVHVGTPKAGLLGGIAACLARVPARVYTLHGLRLETARGFKLIMLWLAERIACAVAHAVVCVSASVRQRAIEFAVVSSRKAAVLGPGSANGAPLPMSPVSIKRSGEIHTIGFLGRLTRDKGIADLVEVFERVQANHPNLRLQLVGDFESGDPIPASVHERIAGNPQVEHVAYTEEPWRHYREIDLLVLPSYREGFPTVVLEAGVFSLPTVAYRATGTVDAVIDGETGLLASLGDVNELQRCIEHLIADPDRARSLGESAHERVARDFKAAQVWRRLSSLYADLDSEVGGITRNSLPVRDPKATTLDLAGGVGLAPMPRVGCRRGQ